MEVMSASPRSVPIGLIRFKCNRFRHLAELTGLAHQKVSVSRYTGKQKRMPQARFEPTILVLEESKIEYALDREGKAAVRRINTDK